jgi:polar amino acid transport system substrate-binding protein
MGLYKGTPTSILPATDSAQNRGIGFELGRDLASQLGLVYDPIIFEKNADVLAAAKNNSIDLVFTNASADREKYIQFSETVIKIEKGYLISPRSKIQSDSQINQKGVKIGFSVGSNSQTELPTLIPNASLVATSSTKQAIALLESGQLDGFSTNKAILYEMASAIPGAKVLPSVIGYEYLALGVPRERHINDQILNEFIDQMRASGRLQAIIRALEFRVYLRINFAKNMKRANS